MSSLAALGLRAGEQRLLLIDPPDGVLVEAGGMKPRPSIASTLQVAKPAERIVWWPERHLLDPARLSRLHWLLEMAEGEGWLVFDPDDEEPLSEQELHRALAETYLSVGETVTLPNGDVAVHVTPGAAN